MHWFVSEELTCGEGVVASAYTAVGGCRCIRVHGSTHRTVQHAGVHIHVATHAGVHIHIHVATHAACPPGRVVGLGVFVGMPRVVAWWRCGSPGCSAGAVLVQCRVRVRVRVRLACADSCAVDADA